MHKTAVFLLALATAWTPLAVIAESTQATIQPYKALYSISRNGKTVGKVEIRLQRQQDRWSISSELAGTRGLARILRVRDNEQVSGIIKDQRFLPESYRRHSRVAGIDDIWTAQFNWQEGIVDVTHDKNDPIRLHMTHEALDPLSLKLEMRRRLNDPDPDLHFFMVEEDEIDEQNFRTLDDEWLETSLGCLHTRPVEKIRTNSKRYTRAWHAAELANIEVRIEHGKTGGDHVELRITELTLGDVDIVPRPGCTSRQSQPPKQAETGGH